MANSLTEGTRVGDDRDVGRTSVHVEHEGWKELVEKYGGPERLAEECGVTTMTLYRWRYGRIDAPKSATILLAKLAADVGLPAPETGKRTPSKRGRK